MITLNQARCLRRRSCDYYRRIRHRNGVEWLVHSVLDNGRMLRCFRADTEGKIQKMITRDQYHAYTVSLY